MAHQAKTTKNPNQAIVRHLRIPDEIWLPACEKAAAKGIGPAELGRALFRAYADGRIEV